MRRDPRPVVRGASLAFGVIARATKVSNAIVNATTYTVRGNTQALTQIVSII
jgi:hypothetical protein